MNRTKFTIFTLFILLFAVAVPAVQAQHHWEMRGEVLDDMSVNVFEALIGEESLVPGDEVGAFTPDGFLGGIGYVEDDGRMPGMSLLSNDAEDGEDPNGFEVDEVPTFRLWDNDAEQEFAAEITHMDSFDGEREEIFWASGEYYRVWLSAIIGDAEAEVNADNHDFGEVIVDQSANWELIISNVGGSDLEVGSVNVNDDNGVFTIDAADEAVVVRAGRTYIVPVNFRPSEITGYEASVTIVTDDPDEADQEFTVTLTGSGIEAPPANIVPSVNLHNFGAVLAPIDGNEGGQRSWTLRIGNDGGSTLTIETVRSGDEVFTTDFDGSVDVQPGENIPVVVTFTPDAIENYATDLTISSNDPDGDIAVRLTGEGIVEGESDLNIDNLDAEAGYEYFFGNVIAGEVGVWDMFIRNNEEASDDLHLYGITSNDESFSTDFDMQDVRLRPGDYYIVEVTFAPEEENYFEAILTIESNDPDGDVSIDMVGVGTDDEGQGHFTYLVNMPTHTLLVESVLLDGESLVVGDEVGVFTEAGACAGGGVMQDDGEDGIRCGITAFGDDEDTDIIDGFSADESFHFKLWDADADLEIDVDEEGVNFINGPEVFTADAWETYLTLSAETPADPPVIELSVGEHFYGQVGLDESEDWTFTIFNTGAADLVVQPIDSDLEEFVTDFGDEARSIAPDELIDVIATFAPSEETQYECRLTLVSNDPEQRTIYLDLYGQGVVDVDEQELLIEEEYYFFGAVGVGRMGEYNLTINNGGGGELVIFDILYAGDEEITTDFGGRRRIEGGGSTDITLMFEPDEAGEFHTTLTFQWNDPTNENFGEIDFLIWGDGQNSDDHFLNRETGSNHSLLVQGAYWVIEDRETVIIAGDEIAVYTTEGLCAGHTVVEEAGADIAVIAYGNDNENDYIDGFQNGEELLFVFYDFGTDQEVIVEDVRYTEGPEVFAADELTTLELRAVGSPEAQIAADPLDFFFGPAGIDLDEPPTTIYTISNVGEENLTIQEVTSDNEVFTTDFDGERVLGAGESFDLTVIFDPVRSLAYVGNITITNSDPDEGEFVIHPTGLGSNFNGHYRPHDSGRNFSILMENLTFGDSPAQPGDEVGVFTEAGYLAGKGLVEDAGIIGITAYGDSPDGPDEVIEGFMNREPITFHFWDNSHSMEYIQGDEHISGLPENPVLWELNEFVAFANEIHIDGIIDIIGAGVDPDGYAEDNGDGVTFDLRLSDPDAVRNQEWAFLGIHDNPDEELVPNNWEFDDNQHFHWAIDFTTIDNRFGDDHRDYELDFQVTGLNDQDQNISITKTIAITVLDSDQEIEETEEAGLIAGQPIVLQEDQDPVEIDLNPWFLDLDDPDNEIGFYIFRLSEIPANIIDLNVANDNMMTITPEPEMFGEVTVVLRVSAEDQRRDHFNLPRVDRVARSLRNDGPRRDPDDTFDYEFTINVVGVNDAPTGEMIDDEEFGVDREADRMVDEGDLLEFVLTAADSDNEGNELTWEMTALGDLEGAGADYFTDNGDGTGTFSWRPGSDDAGQYVTEYTVSDGEGDDIVTVNITVVDVNHAPQIMTIEGDDVTAVDEYDVDLTEEQDLDLLIVGEDSDLNGYFWTVEDVNGNGDWMEAAEDGNLRITWDLGYGNAGDYVARVTLTDDADEPMSDVITINIHVEDVNRIPAVEMAIDAVVIEEDSQFDGQGNEVVRNITPHFSDLDIEFGDSLAYTVDVPVELEYDVDAFTDFGRLVIKPATEHFFQVDPALEVSVTATDLSDASATIVFEVTVTPVNDAPLGFNLLSPDDLYGLPPDDEIINFSWEAAPHDFFGEDEQVITYMVVFTVDGSDTTAVEDLASNVYNDMNANEMLALLDLDRGMEHSVTWKVYAMDDGDPVGMSMSNDEFGFVLFSGVDESEVGIPTEYYMTGSYPNPFNETTTIKYGLPAPGNVELTVWDMHGRKIAELASGIHAAGSYQAVWSAQGVTSGVYFIRIQAENYQAMRKAVLVR